MVRLYSLLCVSIVVILRPEFCLCLQNLLVELKIVLYKNNLVIIDCGARCGAGISGFCCKVVFAIKP